MTPSPIHKVLSSIQTNQVRALLMGGQACVLYGAAEFSRAIDFAVLADAANLSRLGKALDELGAKNIAVPPFDLQHLNAGHAVHFRCQHPEAEQLRVDIMSKMRGVEAFEVLWDRRTTIEMKDGTVCNLLSLPDLVQAKKTQRDKDWPMIRRLVEADYFQNLAAPNSEQIVFWLSELRTAELILQLASQYPQVCQSLVSVRPILSEAINQDLHGLEQALLNEEGAERIADQKYWLPLKSELEKLRHKK